MKIIIDSRMRKIEKEYLSQYGDLIELPYQSSVYDEISSHPDIFFCKINNQIFQAPNLKLENKLETKQGANPVGAQYPEDIKYNICQISKRVIHNFKYTDPAVAEYIDSTGLQKINIKQGYSKCSISVTSENSCITSDKGICETLKRKNIDVLLLDNTNIRLLDKNGLQTKMNGFIGGATAIIEDKFIIFGDSNKILDKASLIEHLNNHNLKLVDFKNLEIIDYGSIITQ